MVTADSWNGVVHRELNHLARVWPAINQVTVEDEAMAGVGKDETVEEVGEREKATV